MSWICCDPSSITSLEIELLLPHRSMLLLRINQKFLDSQLAEGFQVGSQADQIVIESNIRQVSNRAHLNDISYNSYSPQGTPGQASVRSDSPDEFVPDSRFSATHHRKRKRGHEEPETMSYEEQHYLLWADELLDFFMLQDSAEPLVGPPEPPPNTDMNRPMDEKGHTPIHWASAMGDVFVVRDLIQRGARIDSQSLNGETPLMRAVMFTNNFDKQAMDYLVQILIPTVGTQDLCLSTVFHHIAATTCSKAKYACARYYFETILERMKTSYTPQFIATILNQTDQNGDTAILIAARFGARKCVRALLLSGASIEIPNHNGETAEQVIGQLNARRRDRHSLNPTVMSSSPVHEQDLQFGSRGPGNGNAASALARIQSMQRVPITYRSEAANILSSQLPVLVSSRAETLATALEAEIVAREAEVTEGDRILDARQDEVHRLSEECQRYSDELDEENDTGIAETEGELRMLEDEVRDLLEQEQRRELARLVGLEQPGSMQGTIINGTSSSPENRSAFARQLANAQTLRKTLMNEVVSAVNFAHDVSVLSGDRPAISSDRTAPAESRAKHLIYQRLIRGALGMQEEESIEIEELLPEMLKELEEAKRDRDGADEGLADVSMMDVGVASISKGIGQAMGVVV